MDVLTSPPPGGAFSRFKPEFSSYQVVISNYNDCYPKTVVRELFGPNSYSVGCPGGGDKWPAAVRSALEQQIRNGGWFVVYHALEGCGGARGRDDVIVFAPNIAGTSLQRVAATGGACVDATKIRGDLRHSVFLLDGRHFLYLLEGEKS